MSGQVTGGRVTGGVRAPQDVSMAVMPRGPRGPQGEIGPPGPTGPAGPQGFQGQGQPGPSGQPKYSGEGAPPDLIVGAQPGDEYLDTLTGAIYRLT